VTAVLAGPQLLAAGDPDLGAGFIAFVVVLALAVSSYFLLRSMNRHMKRVPDSFEPIERDEPRHRGGSGSP
jgi:hypothetical protein